MLRDEYAKNFLVSDITGSFSFYTLITYRMQIRGHSLFIFCPLFYFVLCPLFLFVWTFFITFHCLVRRYQSRLLRALHSVRASPRYYFWQDVYFFSPLSSFSIPMQYVFTILLTLCSESFIFLFPLPVFSYPFHYSPLVSLLSCVSCIVMASDSLPWKVTSLIYFLFLLFGEGLEAGKLISGSLYSVHVLDLFFIQCS